MATKRFGAWRVTKTKLASDFGYSIDLDRVHEADWEKHVERKTWESMGLHRMSDFVAALEYARSVTCSTKS